MSSERDRLLVLCAKGLETKGLSDQDHKDRLKAEVREIDVQVEYEYFLKLYDRKARFPHNENNLLVAYLLDLVPDFDITQPPSYMQGEFPDIDVDFLPEIQTHLKRVWAPQKFGQEYVCEISTYSTLGIKSGILDMTRVHGVPKDEIQAITVRMEDKDDEGDIMSWDKALEMYPEFDDYCKRYPDISDATKILMGRYKSGGIHPGGLIISKVPIADFVPLEVRSVSKDNPKGMIVSAWAEGQAVQDLQPVGLVKFDVLVVDGLEQIALGCKLVYERHGIKHICAKPGRRNWSDTSYLNDPKALELANRGDTRCIFQLGGEGIRNMVKRGGVTSFDDIAAYEALYRPGPLNMKMDERYCMRKRGKEKYSLHPLMEPILGKTYGVMVFQEQVMQILNKVGNIPLIHCEKVRKAISKKKIEQFGKYKAMFLENGVRNLGATKEYVEHLWDQVEAFADYGFNKSHSYAYSYISSRQLWLLAHYPLEFYTAVLMKAKDDDKIKEYKTDAKYHNVQVAPVHINKSKENFSIQDNKIYFGFSNIKGVGLPIAKKIVEGQPYSSFADFLERFGTEAKVLKPLIALGVFDEPYDRQTMYKFYEFFKDHKKKYKECGNRYEKTLVRYDEDLNELLQEHVHDPKLIAKMNKFDDEAYALWEEHLGDIELEESYNYKGEVRIRKVTVAKNAQRIRAKRDSSMKNYSSKESDFQEEPPSIDSFNANKWKLDEELQTLLSGETKQAEREFYGFQWTHDLEESPDFKNLNIETFLTKAEVEGLPLGYVQVLVKNVKQKIMKNGKPMYHVEVEDSNGKVVTMTVWSEDYDRFAEDFVKGKMLSLRVKPPQGKWQNLTFDSPPKKDRWKLPKNKDEDGRLCEMRPGTPKKKELVDLTDLTL